MTYRLEDQVGYLLRLAHQRATAIFQETMASGQLTPTQFSTLVRLAEEGEVSQNQLGRLTGMDPATVQGVIGRLARRQLIAARSDPADGRRRLWRLTPAGTALVDQMLQLGPVVSSTTLAPLNPEEQRVFVALLKRLT